MARGPSATAPPQQRPAPTRPAAACVGRVGANTGRGHNGGDGYRIRDPAGRHGCVFLQPCRRHRFPTCVFTDWKHVPPSMPATKHPQTAVAGIAPSQPRRPPSGHSSPHGTDTSSRFSEWSTAFQAVRTRVGNPCYRSEGGRDLVARKKIAPSIYRRETGRKRDLQTSDFRAAGVLPFVTLGRAGSWVAIKKVGIFLILS